MPSRTRSTVTATLLAILAAGCNVKPVETAPAGAAPMTGTPVGPIPGPPGHGPALRTNPYAQDPVVLAQGRKFFVGYNCAGCHGGHAGGGMGPSLRDADWIYGNSDAHIFSSITHGRAHGMPAWGTKLPEGQVWMLVSYVKSLRTLLEPEPPKP